MEVLDFEMQIRQPITQKIWILLRLIMVDPVMKIGQMSELQQVSAQWL
jgi:hypothetical protein